MLTDRAAKPSPTYISSERPQTPQEITDYTVYDLREAQYHGEHLTAARAHRSEVERRLAALDRFKMASPAVSTQAELNSSNAGLSQTDSGFSGTDQVRLGRIDPEDSQGTAPVGQISQNLPFSGSTAGYGVKSNDAPQYRSLGTPAAQTSGPKSLQADGVAAGQRQVTVHAVPADSSNLSKPGEAPPTPPRKGVPPQEGSHGQEAGARPGTASNMTAGRQRIPDIAVPSAVQLAKDQEGEDWVSKLIENLWPHIHDVTQDIAWESVPRE